MVRRRSTRRDRRRQDGRRSLAASAALLATMTGVVVLATLTTTDLRAASVRLLGVAGRVSADDCRSVPRANGSGDFVTCTGRFVSADGALDLAGVTLQGVLEQDVGRTVPAWVSGPRASVAYVRVDRSMVVGELVMLTVPLLALLWPAVQFVSPRQVARLGTAWGRLRQQLGKRLQKRHRETDPVDDRGSAGHDAGPGPRSPITAVVMVVIGLLLALGMVDAMGLGPISPVQQVRARYFGSTGTITAWDCRGEWYEPGGRSSPREILVCHGSFRGDDGLTIERLAIYHPRAEAVGRPVAAWVVGPNAEWAFISIEWALVVLLVLALPVFLGFSGWLVYAGVRRLVRGRPRPDASTG